MSLHRLDVVPRDVTADALGLLLGAPAPAALAEATLRGGRGGVLTLGVLGASHVVTGAVDGRHLTEQVSCDAVAAGGERLPRRTHGAGYELVASVDEVARPALEATAARLRARAEADDAWLCGAFPGAGTAVTALTASALPGGGWTWRTWHLYPGGVNVIVTTRSRWTP